MQELKRHILLLLYLEIKLKYAYNRRLQQWRRINRWALPHQDNQIICLCLLHC